MKKVILIGDSIRLGYEKYVAEALKDSCEIYSPPENCRFAEYVLRYLHEWQAQGKWPSDADLVHWNAGLWDALRLFGDEPMTPKEAYRNLIPRIHTRIRMLFPKAKIIFATSTSIVEEKYGESFKRYNREIEEYNAIAKEALSEADCEINDLYTVSIDVPSEARSDSTHFNTPLGAELIGGAVVRAITPWLGLSARVVSREDAAPQKIDDAILGY